MLRHSFASTPPRVFKGLTALGVLAGLDIALLALGGGEAKANTFCNFSNLAACNGTVGNFVISNFALGGSSTGYQATDTIFIFANGQGNAEILASFITAPNDATQLTGSGNFSFTASAINSYKFNQAISDATVAGSTFSFSTSLTSPGGTWPLSPLVLTGGNSSPFATPSSSPTTSVDVVTTWAANGDSASSYNLVFGMSSTVPGPLPLFGAAAAFVQSRQLRRRIKLSHHSGLNR
jgi:hypothetical protein